MKTPQRVVWSEGMFMSPQHLQQQDRYHEELLAYRLSAVSPYDWGVSELDVDLEALGRGSFALRRLYAVMPGGLPVSVDAASGQPSLSREAEELFDPKQRTLEVFLAVAREREGVSSYTHAQKASQAARYLVTSRDTADTLATAAAVPVELGTPRLQLLFGVEPREDFETLKLAELGRDASGALTLVQNYVPPTLRIDAAPFLIDGLRRLLRSLHGKQRELADARRFRDAASLEFTASDVTRFLQLNTLNTLLPVIHHVVESANLSPHAVYILLLQAAGALSTFGVDADPASLPKFQYQDLRETFEALFGRLEALLRSVALEQCLPVPLEARPGGTYLGKLTDERFARCTAFILAVKSDLPEQQVAEQLPKLAKIASRTELSNLLRAATPGVPLQVTFRPPPEVPVRPGVVYFSLGLQDQYWKNAIQEQNVALYLPQTFDPNRTQLELLGVPSAAAPGGGRWNASQK